MNDDVQETLRTYFQAGLTASLVELSQSLLSDPRSERGLEVIIAAVKGSLQETLPPAAVSALAHDLLEAKE